MQTKQKKIVIVGGGFGGIRAALDLAREKMLHASITLVSDRPHFEFNPALYRVVTGNSPLEVCVPLREIFEKTSVEVIQDTITRVNLAEKTVRGASESTYDYNYLMLSLGSETVYFNIPGLLNNSLGFKSISEALRLKRHLHETFESCKQADEEQKARALQIVVVGAGPSGTELAAELSYYCKALAQNHGVNPSEVAVDLVEAAPRILPLLPRNFTQKIATRLKALGVIIHTGASVIKKEGDTLFLKNMEINAKTVIWTAGVRSHHLYSEIEGLVQTKGGRVEIDKYLQAKGTKNVFIVGDGADTPYAGMAQTALHNGRFAADVIKRKIMKFPLLPYTPQKPVYAVPVSRGWAAVKIGPVKLYGRIGLLIRRLADLRFFLSILPFKKALDAFGSRTTLCESCAICAPGEAQEIRQE